MAHELRRARRLQAGLAVEIRKPRAHAREVVLPLGLGPLTDDAQAGQPRFVLAGLALVDHVGHRAQEPAVVGGADGRDLRAQGRHLFAMAALEVGEGARLRRRGRTRTENAGRVVADLGAGEGESRP